MNYYEAAKIRKKGFADLMTDKLTSGQGVFSSVRSALSDRSKARSMAFKEKYDPLNIAKVLTGGSNLAPAMLGKLLGRKTSDIRYFTGKKEYTPRRESSYFNNYTPSSMSTGGSRKATRVLQKMLSFMEKSRTDDMQEQDTLDSFNELNENMREDRHKEVIGVFIEATKSKRKAEKDMAKEAKKRERAAKKETPKPDTQAKDAADAAKKAKEAKDAADAAKKAKEAKDAADKAKEAKDAAEAAKKAKEAKDAADAAKKAKEAKDAAEAAKKAKDAADAAKKAKDAAEAKRIKDAADAAKKAKDAAEAKRIKDAADAKKAADTAKKQESVPKNKSAEKVKETKSEVPTAAPAPATEAAKTAAKVGAGVTAVVGATEVVARIKKKEGFQAKAYHDPKRDKDGRIVEDRYSVGYGHQITPQEVKQGFIKSGDINIPVSGILGKDTVITEKDASVLVNQDFQKYDRAARKITNFDKLGPDAQMAFLDMTYNMGEGWFSPEKWPKLHQALTNLDMYAAADSITNSLYYKQTGKRAVDNVQLIRKSSNIKAIEPNVKSPGTAINNLSSENADMKKDMSQGSSGGSTVIVQNNNTTQAKTNIQRTAPQEQLNPTMR